MHSNCLDRKILIQTKFYIYIYIYIVFTKSMLFSFSEIPWKWSTEYWQNMQVNTCNLLYLICISHSTRECFHILDDRRKPGCALGGTLTHLRVDREPTHLHVWPEGKPEGAGREHTDKYQYSIITILGEIFDQPSKSSESTEQRHVQETVENNVHVTKLLISWKHFDTDMENNEEYVVCKKYGW